MTTRWVLIYQDETGAWIAEVPSLPGCLSEGDTREEVIANIQEAMKGFIEALVQDGLPVPEAYPMNHAEVVEVPCDA